MKKLFAFFVGLLLIGLFDLNCQTIKVLYPNGGEKLQTEGEKTIKWTTRDMNKLVKLEYSSDGGKNWNLITKSQNLVGKNSINSWRIYFL